MTPDQDLITGIGQGDRKAFAELYRMYQDRLYHYALGLLRSPEPAEDALHDVFVALVRPAARGNVPGNVSAYLYAAVRHRCFDMMSRRGEVSAESLDPELLAAPPGDMERIEQRQAIYRMLSALPDDQRETVILRIFHQIDFREIAGLQGVPLSTALSRYHYALKSLRKEFAGDEDE
jgi:RNA polymerase sigma-70 factor (ECF subfamily)